MKALLYNHINRIINKSTTIAILAIVVLFLLPACTDKHKGSEVLIMHRDSISGITTKGVVTLISDSGMISYKIVAEEWDIFDKYEPPYWAFEHGIYLEQYDDSMNVKATIQADTAYYYEKDKLWKLMGNVDINKIGESRIRTSLLFWNQDKEEIYSDKPVEIQQDDKIFWGDGFTSNQDLSKFTINVLKGEIPFEEKETAKQDSITPDVAIQNDSTKNDSI